METKTAIAASTSVLFSLVSYIMAWEILIKAGVSASSATMTTLAMFGMVGGYLLAWLAMMRFMRQGRR